MTIKLTDARARVFYNHVKHGNYLLGTGSRMGGATARMVDDMRTERLWHKYSRGGAVFGKPDAINTSRVPTARGLEIFARHPLCNGDPEVAAKVATLIVETTAHEDAWHAAQNEQRERREREEREAQARRNASEAATARTRLGNVADKYGLAELDRFVNGASDDVLRGIAHYMHWGNGLASEEGDDD